MDTFLKPATFGHMSALKIFGRSICLLWIFLVSSVIPLVHADDQADIDAASLAAENFINTYLATNHGSYQGVLAWVNKRPDVFPIFKERLGKLYLDALKQDPECGYGADAVMGGIEEIGTKYKTVDTFYGRVHIRVTLQAIAPAGCKHHVDVVMIQDDDGKWKVHSCGDIPM